MIEADTVVHRDTELVTEFGLELFARYGDATGGEEFKDVVRAQAAKRVAMRVRHAPDRDLGSPQARRRVY